MEASRPLHGIEIVELSTMVTASLATMMLADQGASVIKVETEGFGDPMRHLGTQKGGVSALFANCNRGKRSLAIDLKTDEGRDAVRALAARADVLVHNFRPGVMDRLGLGDPVLRRANPRLVYASISGFGSEGPFRDAPAYDHVMQAVAGFTAVQESDGRPQFMKTLICDKVTAYTVCQAITAALFERQRTGRGRRLDVSMLDACVFFLWPDGMMNETLLDDDVVPLPPLSASYETIETADGHLSMVAGTDAQWAGVFRALDRPQLARDPRFATIVTRMQNMASLMETLRDAFAKLETARAVDALRRNDVPCAECTSRDALAEHPQVVANRAFAELESPVQGRMRAVRSPVHFDGERLPLGRAAPAHGEHTREILAEIGRSRDSGRAGRS